MDTYESDFDDCLEMARALLSGNEDNADLWEANELVNRAISLRPSSAEAWLLKCQILSGLGDDVAALAAVEMAIRRTPRNAEAHYWKTAVLADLERYDDALRSVERAFRHLGETDEWLIEDLYYEKALILDAIGRQDAALATYEAGLARCPDSAILKSGLEPLRRARTRQRFKVLRGGLG